MAETKIVDMLVQARSAVQFFRGRACAETAISEYGGPIKEKRRRQQ